MNNSNSKRNRNSKQRNKILEILRSTKTHPTADWVFNEAKKVFPGLSMGTVYRNLNVLVEMGLVKKIEHGSTFDRFEANPTSHYHFICESCNSIIDLEMTVVDTLNERVYKETGFKPKSHTIDFYGTCPQCKEKK